MAFEQTDTHTGPNVAGHLSIGATPCSASRDAVAAANAQVEGAVQICGWAGGQPVSRELVVALHCSGSNAGQWRQLGDMLGDDYTLIAPEHYGNAQIGPWPGGHVFTLADEAMQTIALIDRAQRKVILSGIRTVVASRCTRRSRARIAFPACRSTSLPPFIC